MDKTRIYVKKTANEYLELPYRMELIPDTDEGGYVVSFPDLPGCITSGSSLEIAINNAKDAKRAWIEAAFEDGISIPEPEADDTYSVENSEESAFVSRSALQNGGDQHESVLRVPSRKERYNSTV